ncbi:MAG: DNA-binding protein YbiB [Thiobacillus sp.]
MSYATLIRQIESGAGLAYSDARALLAALLDGGVPELETAALLVALHQHAPGLDAWLGMHSALAERLPAFETPAGPFATVVLPAYRGVRSHPHLTPLLALLLKRFDIPVLIHGALDGGGGTAAAYVLRELGVMPCGSVRQVNTALRAEGLAFAPVALFHPGLAAMLALRARLGLDSLAVRLATLADPLGSASLRVVPAASASEIISLRDILEALGGQALLLQGCEGEAFADPLKRPDMLLIRDGRSEQVYTSHALPSTQANLPAVDARATGAWIADVLNGKQPMPLTVRNQLAACLYAAGYTDDLNQARAITALDGFGRGVHFPFHARAPVS